jgi:hypothetical protein
MADEQKETISISDVLSEVGAEACPGNIKAVWEFVYAYSLNIRGVEEPCKSCDGIGSKLYASTAVWRYGIGGAAMTRAVCDKCWGSGDHNKPWADLRKLEAKISQLETDLKTNRERCAKIAEDCRSAATDNFIWECARQAIAKAIRQEGK